MEAEEKVQEILMQCSSQISELMGKPITLVILGESKKKIPFEIIVKAVCDVTDISFEKLIKKDRHREIVIAKQLVSFYNKYFGLLSHKEVAKELRYKEHSTTITGAKKIKDLIDSKNNDVLTAIHKINQQLNISA